MILTVSLQVEAVQRGRAELARKAIIDPTYETLAKERYENLDKSDRDLVDDYVGGGDLNDFNLYQHSGGESPSNEVISKAESFRKLIDGSPEIPEGTNLYRISEQRVPEVGSTIDQHEGFMSVTYSTDGIKHMMDDIGPYAQDSKVLFRMKSTKGLKGLHTGISRGAKEVPDELVLNSQAMRVTGIIRGEGETITVVDVELE